MQSLLNPGDELIIPEPYYACYAEGAKLAGAKVVGVKTRIEDNFEIDAEDLEACITSKTKVLALISPSNPSGTVVPLETMKKIAVLVEKYDLIVVSDELYENVLYDGKTANCFASLPGMREHTIILNGFSKAYCMTGLRTGYMVGPKEIIKPISVPHHSTVICANIVGQIAALAAITGPQDFLQEYRDLYDVRRKIVMEELDKGGIGYARPSGGFFVFADIRKTGMSSFEFCKGLLKNEQVQVFPGTMYGECMDGFIRISFLAEKDTLRDAIKRLAGYYKTLV
jgi:aminotransferase